MPASALRSLVLVTLVFAALGRLAGDALALQSDDVAPASVSPAGLHLSSYASRMCARVDAHGALDSGAGVLQLIDPATGQPLAVRDLAFGPGPMLWAGGDLDLPGVEASVRMLAASTEHHGDQRARGVMHVQLLNHGQDVVLVRLGARLSAGGGDPLRRPADALEFVPGTTTFARDESVITRDGSAIVAWSGPDPEVKVTATPAAADATACTLAWELPVQPNTAYFFDIALAGPAHQPALDEEGWRQSLTSFSYTNLEEQLGWQTDYRGTYVVFNCELPALNDALDASVHFLRTLGEANRRVLWLTDRPYGFPPTDAAVPAEITGLFYEWGMSVFAEDYLHELVDTAVAAGQQLSPDRRVALVSGLATAVRLTQNDETLVSEMAEVIRALIVREAAVEPWLDPQQVRADLAAILVRADPAGGPAAAEKLPALSWAEDDEGPVAAHMLAARKALSSGDRAGFWEHYSALLDGTNSNGLGSMQPGDDLDGRFPVGFMYLSRAMLIDDHGKDLRLLPGAHQSMLPAANELHLPWMPTVFGLVNIETFRSPGQRLAANLQFREVVEPNLIYVHVPSPLRVTKVIDNFGGKVRLMPDGSLATAIDRFIPVGLGFTVAVREVPPAER